MEDTQTKPLIRLGCAVCRRFFLKTVPGQIPLIVIPCPNCTKLNFYVFEEGVLYYMAVNAKDAMEPKASISQEQIAQIKQRCKMIKLTSNNARSLVV